MMILLFDVGNSRIKWRCMEHGEFKSAGQQSHNRKLTRDLLNQMWSLIETPSSVWGISVVDPKDSEIISNWMLSSWGIEPCYITSTGKLQGVINGYNEPEKLGVDRWMALLGASQLYQGNCCVVDCGTAVTIDCMDESREHIGGVIIPGLSMMTRCIKDNTALAAAADGEAELLGRDTKTCLASGATHAIVGALLRVTHLVEQQFSAPVTRIITGGDATRLLPWLGTEWHYEPDLIFIGMVAAMNKG